jgi:hypothetical protein
MMDRRKRSQTVAGDKATAVAETKRPSTATMVGAFCPCCGKTVQDRAVKVGSITVGRTSYFESIEWNANKPFGIRFSAGGRGSLKNWEPIGPEEAPELFEGMRKRLIDAVGEWKAKGWLTEEDLLKSIRR